VGALDLLVDLLAEAMEKIEKGKISEGK